MIDKNLYYSVHDVKLVKANGLNLYDTNGKEYFDCISGTFNLPLGYQNQNIVSSLKKQLEKMTFSSSLFHNELFSELASLLIEKSPKSLNKVHLKNTGGSIANEGAVRIAQFKTSKRDVITMFKSHFGQSVATTCWNGYASRKEPFPDQLAGTLHVPPPYCYRCFYDKTPETCNCPCVSKIADFIKYGSSGSIACLMIEPIFGVGGAIVPPKKYFKKLEEFCKENNIILIFDEVQTGFGRTGSFLAAEHFDVSPNILTLAKGLTGSGLALGAILTEENLTGMDPIYHSFTGSGSLLAFTSAIETIKTISEPSFLANITKVGKFMLDKLTEMKNSYPFIGDVRGAGLILGIEIVDEKNNEDIDKTKKLIDNLIKEGIITRITGHGDGNVIPLSPPLTITLKEAETILNKIGNAFDAD